MDAHRMGRAEFFAKTEPLDAGRLRAALWKLYCRGSFALRERIEDALEPERARRGAEEDDLDGEALLAEARGETARARELVQACLETLPRHPEFLAFAREVCLPVPENPWRRAAP